jgi:outer membrane protein TolC
MLIAVFLSSMSVAVAQSDSLNYYLQTAAQNNPGVKAGFLTYQAALQKLPQAGAYQDPQLEMGFFLRPMDIVDGRQIGQLQLMQMFPWFGTKKAARTEAQHMAKMAFEQFREMRDNIFLEVYTQWYMLCSLQQKLKNSRENIALLKHLETLALQKFKSPVSSSSSSNSQRIENPAVSSASSNAGNSSGGMSGMNMGSKQAAGESSNSSSGRADNSMSGSSMAMGGASSGMAEALRIRLEMAEYENSIESILSEINAEKARFNVLLNRPAETGIAVPDSITQILFSMDEETVMNLITAQNPMLGMINEESLAYEAKAEMDRKMSYPMFGIGLQYMLIAKSATSTSTSEGTMDSGMDESSQGSGANMSSMNGKDMIMPMLSVSIPIFRGKYKAQQRKTKLLLQANEEKYVDALNTLHADLYRSKHQLDEAVRKIALYRKQAELAQTTYNIVLQEFISGKSGLSDIIQIQRQLLDYRLKTAEAIAEYNTKVATVQKMISTTDYQDFNDFNKR